MLKKEESSTNWIEGVKVLVFPFFYLEISSLKKPPAPQHHLLPVSAPLSGPHGLPPQTTFILVIGNSAVHRASLDSKGEK